MTFAQAVKILAMKEPFTDKQLTSEQVIKILKEDVVLAVERPGSWEGSNMLEVFRCHGFFIE